MTNIDNPFEEEKKLIYSRGNYLKNGKHYLSDDAILRFANSIPNNKWYLVYLLKEISEFFWQELQKKTFNPPFPEMKLFLYNQCELLCIVNENNDERNSVFIIEKFISFIKNVLGKTLQGLKDIESFEKVFLKILYEKTEKGEYKFNLYSPIENGLYSRITQYDNFKIIEKHNKRLEKKLEKLNQKPKYDYTIIFDKIIEKRKIYKKASNKSASKHLDDIAKEMEMANKTTIIKTVKNNMSFFPFINNYRLENGKYAKLIIILFDLATVDELREMGKIIMRK